MPTIALKSKVRTASEHCSLSLNIRHRLLLDQPSDSVFDMKPTIPEDVDVLLFSNLLITVSGSLDGKRIMPAELKTSYIANHLLDCLQTNAGELGINAVSDLYISKDTHLLSLTLTTSRHCLASTDTLPVHLKLLALDLDYVWQTNSNATASGRLDAAINPFARRLSLPYLTTTDNAVGRFVSYHLVRRYPLIFGPWCKQLDVECSFFPSILISIQNIIKRSRSPIFQATCQKMFKLCKREIMSTSISAAGSLSKYLGLEAGTYSAPAIYAYNEEETFILCLERFYRLGMKRSRFRHLSLSPAITAGSSEDLLSDALISLDVNCSSSRSCEASGLLPHVSLFEGASSDLELNTEDDSEHRVTPPDSYQNNNAPQSLDQICHLTNTAKLSDQDLYDDIYNLVEDEVGSFGTFGKCPSNKDDYSKDDSSDFAVDSGIGCLPEEPDGGWHCRNWSPDILSYDQDSLGKVSSSDAYSLSQPLKMPASLYSRTGFEDILDPLYVGYYGEPHSPNALAIPTLRSLTQTEDIIQACLASQGSSSGDGLELDIQIDLTSDSEPVFTDGDHGIMVFDLVPKSSQAFNSRSGSPGLFSVQHSGQPMCEYDDVITDDDFIIEYDLDVAA